MSVEAELAVRCPGYEDLRQTLPRRGDYGRRRLESVRYIAVHHTAGPAAQAWQSIARFHTGTRGWPGIGYHIGIRLGQVAYLGDVSTTRANVWGRNHEVIGIAMTGDYQNVALPHEYVVALRAVVEALDRGLGRQLTVSGHRDLALPGHGTVCPGRFAAAALASARAAPPATTADSVDWRKVVWWLEEAQRRLEREGYWSESSWIAAEYVRDALAKLGLPYDGPAWGDPDWRKVVWSLEESQRRAGRERQTAVASTLGDYVRAAMRRRDGPG
jgi:hypothetical protein